MEPSRKEPRFLMSQAVTHFEPRRSDQWLILRRA